MSTLFLSNGMGENSVKKNTRKKRYPAVLPTQGYDGRFELGVVIVDDPYETGSKLAAQANVRHDVLIHWRSRKQVDDAQFLAGQRLQNIWYRAGTGMMSSVRFGHDRVDASGGSDPFPERVAAARAELREIAIFLGQADYLLITRILCEGRRIEDEAKEFKGREPNLYVARRVRDALGYLADYWGTTGKAKTPMRAETQHAAT